MKLIRTFALIISIGLLVSACGKDDGQSVASAKENSNPLLAHVPADTAYVYANLENLPKEVTDAYVDRFQPAMDMLHKHIGQLKEGYAAGQHQDDAMVQFAMVVLEEMGGDLSVENLEKLGISLQADHAIYAMGVFPVMRLELTDATELLGFIGRVEARMGMSLPVNDLNGTSFWRVSDEDQPMGLYISILDKQLVVAAFPTSAEADFLAEVLGQEMPANNMAENNTLAQLNQKKGYLGYGSGMLDMNKLSDEFLTAGSTTRSFLGPEVSAELETLDPTCIAEVKSMIAIAPRMTVGTTAFTANEMAVRYDLEFENSLAAGLMNLVSGTPSAAEGDYLMSASLALKVGKLRNFILEKATSIAATPFECIHLQELNSNAEQMAVQLNIPMPPMVNNLNGVRIRMDDFDPATELNQANGLIAVHVDKPEMFVGMASMMVPGFDKLDLANQSEPVKVPSDVIPLEGIDMFALMGKNAIGAAVGEQYAGELKVFMNAQSENNNTFFSVSYDMAKQLMIQEAMSESLGITQADQHVYTEEIKQLYIDMLGRSRIDMKFTSEGLSIDSKMTFK